MDGNFFTTDEAQRPLMAYAPPVGFSTAADGIYLETTQKDGEVEMTWLCSPIAVVAIGSNAKQTGWSRRVELTDPDGAVHSRFVQEKELTVSFRKVLADLTDLGLRVAGGNVSHQRLKDLIARWEPSGRYITTDRLGWTDDRCAEFVLGSKRVIGSSNTVFINELAPNGAPEMNKQGTLTEWRDEVSARCVGNPVLMASVSLAFAGPLLGLLERESAGLHLRGGSSSGKTTALGAAVSVWGGPKFMQSWRATANVLEGVAATRNGSLLALDELGQISGKEVGDAVYTLANGQGKARSSSTGRLQAKGMWRMMLLSTGEISLADKMAEVGKTPMKGQDVRLIDIAADTRRFGVFDELHGVADSAAFANEMKKATANYFGVAGEAFVAKLIAKKGIKQWLLKAISNSSSRWSEALDCSRSGPSERVLGHFALIAFAGELATFFGITGWEKGGAHKAVSEIVKDWRDAQDQSERWQIEAAVERTRAYLHTHGNGRFEKAGGQPIPNCAGYCDDRWFYILGDTWAKIHAGYSPTDQAKHMWAGNMLIRGDGKNLKCKTPSWVDGRPRAFKVRADILKAH
nr:DUF927 domain-containing protein [Amylibacter sp.]